MFVLNFLQILLIITVASAVTTVRPVTIPGNDNETCPPQDEREIAIQNINYKTAIKLIYTLQDINSYVNVDLDLGII